MNTAAYSRSAQALSISALVEKCRQEIQAYRRGKPSNGAYGLELLHRAIMQGDQDAWNGVQQSFGESVRVWLHGHPRREAASRLESEETYMAQAFERFRQAAVQQQIAFQTLSGAGVYLRASLHGVIVDRLRTSSLPREAPCPVPGEPRLKNQIDSNAAWEALQALQLSEREQRLAYLLYHCGLGPREIVRLCPQDWSDVQEIYRLRCNILQRVLRNTNQLRWQFHQEEENDGLP